MERKITKQSILKHVPLALEFATFESFGRNPYCPGLTKEEAFRASIWGVMEALQRPERETAETLEEWVRGRILDALGEFADQVGVSLKSHYSEFGTKLVGYGEYWLKFRLSLSVQQLALCDEICHEYRNKLSGGKKTPRQDGEILRFKRHFGV